MTPAGDDAAETLYDAAQQARAAAVANLTTARAQLDGVLERLKWAPTLIAEINGLAVEHIENAHNGFTELRRFGHFLRGAAALDAQPEAAPATSQPDPSFMTPRTEPPPAGTRDAKLSSLASEVVNAAIEARLNLDTLLELPDAAQADDAVLARTLADVESRCGALREFLQARSEVQRCAGSA